MNLEQRIAACAADEARWRYLLQDFRGELLRDPGAAMNTLVMVDDRFMHLAYIVSRWLKSSALLLDMTARSDFLLGRGDAASPASAWSDLVPT